MNSEYNALASLKQHPGYDVLMALWAYEFKKIVDACRKAAKQNKELNWRYFAGQQEGFELAITHLERAMKEMEAKGEDAVENLEAKEQVEALMKKLKGEAS